MAQPETSNKREVKSRRAAIRKAIDRRIKNGESLAIRKILEEAGGGSTDTVREELNLASEQAATALISGHEGRNQAERESTLRERLATECSKNRALTIENQRLNSALDAAAKPSAMMLERFSHFESNMRGLMETSKEASGRMLLEANRLTKIQTAEARTKVEADPLTEARYARLSQDYAALVSKYEKLRSLYCEKTGEFPD